MKKLFLLLVLAVMTPSLFAQPVIKASDIKRIVKASQTQKEVLVNKLEKQVLTDLAYFRKQVFVYNYYDYNTIFQLMDNLRVSYMKLREQAPNLARAIAPKADEFVKIAYGDRSIRLTAYLNMETCNLWQSEQEKFYAFGQALEEDLRQGVALPDDFQTALAGYQKYVQQAESLKSDWVLQSMMPVMDSFNEHVKKHPALGPAMAKMIEQPVKAGWGTEVVASEFIKDHGCELWQIGDQLEDFRDQLLQFTR